VNPDTADENYEHVLKC